MRRSDGSPANFSNLGSEVTGNLITETTIGVGDAPALGTDPNPATCRQISGRGSSASDIRTSETISRHPETISRHPEIQNRLRLGKKKMAVWF